MYARVMVIAVTLAIGTSAVAEPSKPQAPATNPPTNRPAEVVLASAEAAREATAASNAPAPAPVKRRAARVTTCRCGDPQPAQPDSDQQ